MNEKVIHLGSNLLKSLHNRIFRFTMTSDDCFIADDSQKTKWCNRNLVKLKLCKANKNNPDDIAPNTKYLRAPSPLLIEKFREAINTNTLNVCNSKAKYVKTK